jgi:hypothetical protein
MSCYYIFLFPLEKLTKYLTGKIIDRDYRRMAASVGFTIDKVKGDDLTKFPIEKARVRSIWYFIAISTSCTLGYGWALHVRTARNVQQSFGESGKVELGE